MSRPAVCAVAVSALLAAFVSPSSVRAGEGPWTLQSGEQNVYVGLQTFRYGEYDGGGTQQSLDTDVIATGLVGVWTLGLAQGYEVELQLPWESARVGDPNAPACTQAPRGGWCAPTSGVGDAALLVKTRFIDEVFQGPLSVSGVFGLRTGEAYSKYRGRLTNLGDGQTDLGASLTAGRTDVLRNGWYRVHATAGYWYRLPHTDIDDKVPADELRYDFSAVASIVPALSLGPALYGFQRLGGQELGAADLSDINGFSSLDAAQIQAGGKLGLHPPGGYGTVSLGVLRTVYARNNPTDTLAISVGVGFFFDRGEDIEVELPPLPE